MYEADLAVSMVFFISSQIIPTVVLSVPVWKRGVILTQVLRKSKHVLLH